MAGNINRVIITGNLTADRRDRLARFHMPYHDALAGLIRQRRPTLLASIHSFTPRLETGALDPRPWEVGILYNRDHRTATLAIELLTDAGIVTGDNEPYSGRLLNATLNRHGEANRIPSLAIEVRNDLIADPAGVARWTEILAPMLETVRNRLAQSASTAT